MSNRIDSQIDDMFKLVEMCEEMQKVPPHNHQDVGFLRDCPGCVARAGMWIYGPREEDVPADKRATPYPWCMGNPTKQDCIQAGYCRRDPNCGE